MPSRRKSKYSKRKITSRRKRRSSSRRSRLMSIETSSFDSSKYTTLEKDDEGQQQVYFIYIENDTNPHLSQLYGIFSSIENAKEGLKSIINDPKNSFAGIDEDNIIFQIGKVSINKVLEAGHSNNMKTMFKTPFVSSTKLDSNEKLKKIIIDAIDSEEKDGYDNLKEDINNLFGIVKKKGRRGGNF